jgi:hypothetical protein
MASQPDPSPDRIDPQAPPEVSPVPVEQPVAPPPDIVPPAPDEDRPGSVPPELPPGTGQGGGR